MMIQIYQEQEKPNKSGYDDQPKTVWESRS